MTKSKYGYCVEEYKGISVLCLEDLGDGKYMTLTNDIENVVLEVKRELVKLNKLFPTKIIYKDSEGQWDGWNDKKQGFTLLFAGSKKEALKLIIER